MRYPLLFALPLCMAAQMAFAEKPVPPALCDGCDEIVEDPEPNWETTAYTCPLSIRTPKGEFKFSGYKVFGAGDPLAKLRPAPRKYIHFTFSEKDEMDIACWYKGFNTPLVMQRLRGLTACGINYTPPLHMACWTTDPYAGKK
ncbi:MAG: hypothetical protein LBP58_09310 [Azoarcus sp.]|jgi:hypothetical protein|nr:hypothetical protein [Azoarcus sp.]